MLKRNLIFIAIIGLAMIFSANASGQPNTRKAKPKPKPFAGDTLDGVGIRRKPSSKSQRTNRPSNIPRKHGRGLDGKGDDVNVGEDDFRKAKPKHKMKAAKAVNRSRTNNRNARKPKGILPFIEGSNRQKPNSRHK